MHQKIAPRYALLLLRPLLSAAAVLLAGVVVILGAGCGQAPAMLSTISIGGPAAPLIKGSTGQLSATGTYSDGSTRDLTTQVTWATSDPGVLDVSNGPAGRISAVSPGVVTISALLGDRRGSFTLGVTTAPLSAISISAAPAALARGLQINLQATGTYADGSTGDITRLVSWSSSDPAVAGVLSASSGAGLVTGVSQGSVSISASLSGRSASVTLVVTEAILVSLAVSPMDFVMTVGATQQMLATGTYSDGTTGDLTSQASFISSDESIVMVSGEAGAQGQLKALAAGVASLTTRLGDLVISTTIQVTD